MHMPEGYWESKADQGDGRSGRRMRPRGKKQIRERKGYER